MQDNGIFWPSRHMTKEIVKRDLCRSSLFATQDSFSSSQNFSPPILAAISQPFVLFSSPKMATGHDFFRIFLPLYFSKF